MTYDIGIPEIKCIQRYEDTDGLSIKYDAEAIKRPTSCPNTSIEHDNPHFHMRLYIHVP